MSDSYFVERKEWSARKHELVSSYLESFTKILGGSSRGIVYYVDGFAGRGMYDDGVAGSLSTCARDGPPMVG